MTVTVDIPVLAIGDSISTEGLDKLRQTCLDHGFFYLENKRPDGGFHIPPSDIQSMWSIAEQIMAAPAKDKLAVHVKDSSNHRGYFCSADYAEYNQDPDGIHIPDNKEGFFFGSDGLIAPGNVAPSGEEALIPEVEAYMRKCRDTCTRIMAAVAATGLMSGIDPSTFTTEYLADPIYMLKLLKYPPQNGNTDAHTDYGLITLLLPGDSGLQIHSVNAWHDVPVVPDAFVINLGDLLAKWTNGKIKSTIHRVMYTSPEGKVRYSIPFFMHPSRGTIISCATGDSVDSYSYVLQRFDNTYSHRQDAKDAKQ